MPENIPSVRSRTIIETNAPGVLGWAGGDVGGPSMSTTRPPGVVSGRGKVRRTAGASTVGLRNVGDIDAVELLHPQGHLVGEEG